MDIPARLYAESVLQLLLRAGVIDDQAVIDMADEHDLIGSRNPEQANDRAAAAHRLRLALIDLDPPPAIDPAVTRRAEYLRSQMRERTAMIAKDDE